MKKFSLSSVVAATLLGCSVGLVGLSLAADPSNTNVTVLTEDAGGVRWIVSPSHPLPTTGGGVSGIAATIAQGTSPWVDNVTQFGSYNVVSGVGVSKNGVPRVTVANDSFPKSAYGIRVDASSAVQPISASSLPLPTGAATAAHQVSEVSALTTIATNTTSTEQTPFYIAVGDTASRDAFGRFRTSTPTGLFDSQFTYDLQPLQYEQIASGVGATVTYDSTNRDAALAFSSSPSGSKTEMQTFKTFRYQPGKSQEINMSFNFLGGTANVVKFAGYSDHTNGIEFQTNGSTLQWVILSGTGAGNQTITQANWNLDKLDGTGTSGVTLDISKDNILVIDLQALYTGRVRVGFNIGGKIVYVHQFLNANVQIYPYIQSANLPLIAGMTSSGTVTASMTFTCASVISEGGSEAPTGYEFSQDFAVVAGNNTAVHALSIRPRATFNGITNRVNIDLMEINLLDAGANPVDWQLCIGETITGTTTYNDVNTTYSAVEYNTAGTLSGTPTICFDQGYIASGSSFKESVGHIIMAKYPIALSAAGAPNILRTVSVIVTGITGTSQVYGALKWEEVR